MYNLEKMPLVLSVPFYYSMGNTLTNFTFASAVQEVIKSGATFDVIILEEFLATSLMGLSHYYKAPLILVCAMGANHWNNNLFGNPSPLAYIPNILTAHSSHMNFFQRLHNFLVDNLDLLYRHLIYYPKENEILHRYLPEAPHLNEIMYNASLILLNSHTSYRDPVPLLPNMIEIGGYHVSEPQVLPHDLKTFLDAATEGVVYFSMGSNLKSADMPREKQNAILQVFAKIKQQVLWKFESDDIQDLPKNVKIQKWLPQQDLLGVEWGEGGGWTLQNVCANRKFRFSPSERESIHFAWRPTQHNRDDLSWCANFGDTNFWGSEDEFGDCR